MIKIYKKFDGEIKDLWLELEENSNIFPFQSYHWLLNWQKTAGKKYKVFLTCIFLNDRLEAIFPFGIKSSNLISKLEWLGGSHSDYMAPILRFSHEGVIINFESLWGEVLSALPNFDILNLSKQIPELNSRENPFLNIYPSNEIMHSYQSVFDNGWSEFQAGIPKKVLADSVRQRKRLAEHGNLKFNFFDSDEQCPDLLEQLFSFKQQRYVQMGVKNFLESKDHQDFYSKLPLILDSKTKVHRSSLTLDDEVIALHWGVTYLKTFYYLMPAHNTGKWSKYSPGKLLLEDLLKWSHDNQFTIFDFTGGEEPYKKIWSNRSFLLYESTHAFSIRGKIYLYFLDAARAVKKIIKKLLGK